MLIVSSLRNFNFRLWLSGIFLSAIGTWAQNIAQDWLVLTQFTKHSATVVGIVTALQVAPHVLLLPFTGLAADYLDQRKLLVATQGTLAILAFGQGFLYFTGHLELGHLYLFALIGGVATAFDTPCRQSFAYSIVGPDHLQNATALNSTVMALARIVGPGLAGLLLATAGAGWAFLFNAASFSAVLASIFFLRGSELFCTSRPAEAAPRLRDMFAYAWRDANIRAIMMALLLIGTFSMNFPIFISAMAVGPFQADAAAFGFLSSALAAGSLCGALIAASHRRTSMHLLAGSTALFSAGCAAAALAPTYVLFAGALVVMGIATLTFQTTTNILLQHRASAAMRGRMLALRLALILGGLPLGAPLTGWVADRFGPRWTLGVASLAAAAALLLIVAQLKRNCPRPANQVWHQNSGSAE